MREMKSQPPLERNAKQTFRKEVYLITDFERKVAELQRDLNPLQQPGQLTNRPGWRTFLARANEQIRSIPYESPEQTLSRKQARTAKAAAALQQLKTQATADHNRHVRALRYEGVRGIPQELSPRSEPASLTSREAQLMQTYNLDLPTTKQRSDDLDALKARIEAQKPEVPGAFSQKAQRQRRSRSEQIASYNRWIERFEMPENEKLPEDRLKGGVYLHMGSDHHLYTRFLSLSDPSGGRHMFHSGETSAEIAAYTAAWVERPGTTRSSTHRSAEELTVTDVNNLSQGDTYKGWRCRENRLVRVQLREAYTDANRVISVVEGVPYRPGSEIPNNFQGVVLGRAGHHTDCLGTTFLEGRGRFFVGGDEVQAILVDNGYFQIEHTQGRRGDICIYVDEDGINHASPVLGWSRYINDLRDNPNAILPDPPEGLGYHLMVRSKLGGSYEVGHAWDDPGIQEWYGVPQLYRTDRQGGNTLRRA